MSETQGIQGKSNHVNQYHVVKTQIYTIPTQKIIIFYGWYLINHSNNHHKKLWVVYPQIIIFMAGINFINQQEWDQDHWMNYHCSG